MTMHPAAVVADITALATIVGAATHVLPDIGAGLAALWYAILIWDRLRGRGKRDRGEG